MVKKGAKLRVSIPCILWVLAFAQAGAIAEDSKSLTDAVDALNQKNFSLALSLLRPLAESGNPEAELQVGYLYYWGHGVNRDGQEAERLFKLAADQGNAQGQYELARLYQSRGMYQEAMNLYKLSADQDYAPSMFGIGVLYEAGMGVPKNPAEGLKWIKVSADKGAPDAEINLELRYENGGQGLPKDPEKAVFWMKKCAGQKIAGCQYSLGTWYLYGRQGVPVSPNDAIQMFESIISSASALDSQVAQAQAQLGLIYANGAGVVRDYSKAAEYWRAALGKGTGAIAEFGLGALYYEGRGVPRDYTMAAKLWEQTAQVMTGTPVAARMLGRLYAEGKGVSQDKVQSYEWFEIASYKGDRESLQERAHLASLMTEDEIRLAQMSAKKWAEIHAGPNWQKNFKIFGKSAQENYEMGR